MVFLAVSKTKGSGGDGGALKVKQLSSHWPPKKVDDEGGNWASTGLVMAFDLKTPSR